MTGKKLNFLNKNLTLWKLLAMALNIGIGYFILSFPEYLNSFNKRTTNLPIAIGLILMMDPPLVKVRYSLLSTVIDDIYNELIEENMNYGGDVDFLPAGELEKFNGFGAVMRYW